MSQDESQQPSISNLEPNAISTQDIESKQQSSSGNEIVSQDLSQNKTSNGSLSVPQQKNKNAGRSSKLVYIPTKNGQVAQIDFAAMMAAKKKKDAEKKLREEEENKKKKKESEKKKVEEKPPPPPPPPIIEEKVEEEEPPQKPVKKVHIEEPDIYLGYDRNKLFDHIEQIQKDLKDAKQKYNQDKKEEYDNLNKIRQQEYFEKIVQKSRHDMVNRRQFSPGIRVQQSGFSKPIFLHTQDNDDYKNDLSQQQNSVSQKKSKEQKIKVVPWRPGGQKPKLLNQQQQQQQQQQGSITSRRRSKNSQIPNSNRSLSPRYSKIKISSEQNLQQQQKQLVQQQQSESQNQNKQSPRRYNNGFRSPQQIMQYCNNNNGKQQQIQQNLQNGKQVRTMQNLDIAYNNYQKQNILITDLTLENEIKSVEKVENPKKFDDFVQNKYNNTLYNLKNYVQEDIPKNMAIQQGQKQYVVISRQNNKNQTKLPNLNYKSLSPEKNINNNNFNKYINVNSKNNNFVNSKKNNFMGYQQQQQQKMLF